MSDLTENLDDLEAIEIEAILDEGNLSVDETVTDMLDIWSCCQQELDEQTAHEILGLVVVLGKNGNVYTAVTEVNILPADPALVQTFLDDAETDDTHGPEVIEKLKAYIEKQENAT